MSITRRNVLFSSLAATVTGLLTGRRAEAQSSAGSAAGDRVGAPARRTSGRAAVITPNVGPSLPYKMVGGVKEFHLIAEPVKREFMEGFNINCWGYNGSTPGPTIEAFEGDRVRILVTNNLPEGTSVHWHGFIIPNGMDGVSGLN